MSKPLKLGEVRERIIEISVNTNAKVISCKLRRYSDLKDVNPYRLVDHYQLIPSNS